MNHNSNNIKGVRLSHDVVHDLEEVESIIKPDKKFYLFEENTYIHCKPLFRNLEDIDESDILVLKPGEENKSIDQLMKVWDFFEDRGAGRNSLLVTIGGGMLTDLGGLAACTFKRGMSFVNIPTTLLAMVDASVGGKTGINYRGLKNEIGIIRQPDEVIIHTPFLKTLDNDNFLSGFAEMLKAGLIMDKALWIDLINYDLDLKDLDHLTPLIWRSVEIKDTVVKMDPEEVSDRRSLNFGHTIAHALESLSLFKNDHIHHGYAVAYGMIIESALSSDHCALPADEYSFIRQILESIYGRLPEEFLETETLINYMRSDKKNDNDLINITMIETIGKYRINNYLESKDIIEALKNY